MAATMTVMIAACAAPPPPAVVPTGEARFLVDPRTGWSGPSTPAVERAFDRAWRHFLAGDYATAHDMVSKLPDYGPAVLLDAAIDIRQERLDEARRITDRLLARFPNYTAADVYEAEIDVAQNQLRSAYQRYGAIAARPVAPPLTAERLAEIQTRLFDQLYNAALTASDAQAIHILRDALTINPTATAARILLVQKLLAQKNYDEARRELDPLVNSNDVDLPEVQEALAEIDVGRGRYQEAINRYERLSHNDRDGRYARRLQQVKEQFADANMPPQVLRALNEESITRADLAVLMYWKVPSIRFAQDVPAPPIAIDIGEVPERDEIIRAIALGIYQVDPITRRVNPFTPVTTSGLARTAARVLAVRGAQCARGLSGDSRILAACGIDDPTATGFDASVNGRAAAAVLDQIDRALH